MKIYFDHYGWLHYIDKDQYCHLPTFCYVETFFKEHAEQGYVSMLPFKLFGVNSIDVVYNTYDDKYYFTFLQ